MDNSINSKEYEINKLEQLFQLWKKKPKEKVVYNQNNQKVELTIDHSKVFISDGIVNKDVWNKLPPGKKILVLLKEAYGGEANWSLSEKLLKEGPWNNTWNRIAEWSYGLLSTDSGKITPYDKLNHKRANDFLQKIAIMNIRKSGGETSSVDNEIKQYAIYDKKEIIREIELIDPDIVICGGSIILNSLDEISNKQIIKNPSDLISYYYSDAIGKKERLFIDFYHPACRYPRVLMYYGVVNLYQQALINKQ